MKAISEGRAPDAEGRKISRDFFKSEEMEELVDEGIVATEFGLQWKKVLALRRRAPGGV